MKKAPKKLSPQRVNRPQNKIKLGRRFRRAFEFAAAQHAGQTRKESTIPYIAHLMGVASLVLEAGGDEDLAIARCCTMLSRTAAVLPCSGKFSVVSAVGSRKSSTDVPTPTRFPSRPGTIAK